MVILMFVFRNLRWETQIDELQMSFIFEIVVMRENAYIFEQMIQQRFTMKEILQSNFLQRRLEC
jgi:hypothetical protein